MLCNVCKESAVPCAKHLHRNEGAMSQDKIFRVCKKGTKLPMQICSSPTADTPLAYCASPAKEN